MPESDSQRKSVSAAPKLPHNLEAEQALLGALLFDNELLARVRDLAPEHFYDPVHGRIYDVIRSMIRAGRVADGVTLKAKFAQDDAIHEIGGAVYLMKLMEAAAPLSAQAQSYADLIHDLAVRRSIWRTAQQMSTSALMPAEGEDAEDLLATALQELDGLAASGAPDAWRSLKEIMPAAVARARAGKLVGITTGISGLDARINGLRRGTFVVIGGRVKMGKTVVGMSLVRSVADQRPRPDAPKYGVAVFSLEMDEDEIGVREASDLSFAGRATYAGRGGDPAYFDAMRGELDEKQWGWLEDAAASRNDWNVEIDFTPGLTPSQIETRCRRLFHKWKRAGVEPYLVVIDHMGLVKPDRKNSARAAERADVIDDIDALKKKLKVCVVGLSQINRAGDSEERPNNTHLEWSDRIAANAQAVVLLYRPDYYLLRKPELSLEETTLLNASRGKIELIVDLVRGGDRGTVTARLNLPTASLRDLDAQ